MYRAGVIDNVMNEETIHQLTVENFEFVFSIQDVNGTAVLNFDDKRGGYVFIRRHKESLWSRFTKWVDSRIFKNKTTFKPEQWVDVLWFKGKKHQVRSYNFVPVGKDGGKSHIAPYAASLGLLYCFLQKDNVTEAMPDYVQVHFRSVFGNKSFLYGKITDSCCESEIISSFVVCKSMSEKHKCCQGSQSIH